MRGADLHFVKCQPTVFSTIKARRITLALCGAILAFFDLAANVSAENPLTLDSTRTPELVVPASCPLELRGIVVNETGSSFGFYNLKNGRSTWIALGRPMDGFIVRSHDEGSDWITAEFEGHIFTMALKKTLKVENGITTAAPSLVKGDEANRAEIQNKKALRRKAQKARIQKMVTNNENAVP